MSVTTIQKKESDNMNETSQQIPVADVERTQGSAPFFSVEINEHVFANLSQICAKEKIPLKLLAPQLLARMLCGHRREIIEILETLKKRTWRG